MRVFTLVTVPRPELWNNCTLFLHTIRTGFPTAEICVFGNDLKEDERFRLHSACDKIGAEFEPLPRVHHARWIEDMINLHSDRIAIVDPDTVWWENCENIKVPEPFLWAGRYVPAMWNEWARCRSTPRLHSEFVLIPDVIKFHNAVAALNKEQYEPGGEYCTWDPYYPRVFFLGTMKFFCDTLSQLYSALPGWAFDEDVKNRYDHLNSAAFFDIMCTRVAKVDGFKEVHRLAQENPKELRGLWREIDFYYNEMAQKSG